MQSILSSLEDANDFVSTLTYISQIETNFLHQHELEALCLELYNCVKTNEASKSVEIILHCLMNIEKQNCLTFNVSCHKFIIHINDQRNFKLVLLASLRNCKAVFNKKDLTITVQQKLQIVRDSVLTFRADRLESVLILRLIENIIKKNRSIIDSELALQLLFLSETAAISPIELYKSYAHSISKMALQALKPESVKYLLDFNLLPIKGIETLNLVPYFTQASYDRNVISNLVTKVIQMFSNNIENRDGGFLYRNVLFEDFSYWRELVWPQFFVKFQMIDVEGEFIQSLIKYWIPQCVSTYKLEFYTFMCTVPIPNYLKGYILLETKRRGLFTEYNNEMIQLLRSLLADDTTSTLALTIVSSYVNKSLHPCDIELQIVKSYLYENTEGLDNEELKCLHRFLSQIGVVGSEFPRFAVYQNYVVELFRLFLKLLESNKKSMGAQGLMVFWRLTNGENLDKDHNMGFYGKVSLYTAENIDLIERALLESNGNVAELTKLGQVVLATNKLYSNDYLVKFIDDCTTLVSVKAAESVKNVLSIIVFQNEPEENVSLFLSLFDAVSKHFQVFSPSLKSVFKGVLLFEAILMIHKEVRYQEVCLFLEFATYFLPVTEIILQNGFVDQIYQQEIKMGCLDSTDQQYNLLCKIQKIVESLLNNMLLYILQDESISLHSDKPKIMNLLIKIIETSNMRRPTTLSAEALKHIAKSMNLNQNGTSIEIVKSRNKEVSFKIQLLHNTLQKLMSVNSRQNLTIRRNPESRLIIHALCQSDVHPQKPLLAETLRNLLKILSDPKSTDPTVASAIHCTDILISDNTLYNHTLKFVPDVISQCVDHFKNRNWIVRNANIQLARAVIDRFFGVLIGPNNRPKSLEDLFRVFPQLTARFCQTLTHEPLTDSAVIVMQMFSESQIKSRPFRNEQMRFFLRLFAGIIKVDCGHYGLFAVRAFTSLCLEDDVPEVIKHVIDFIIDKFTYIRERHTITNFVFLLRELYDKFWSHADDFPVKPHGYYVTHLNFDRLSTFLSQLDLKQFDLLLLKVLSSDQAMERFQTSNFDKSDYTQRVWQHNYTPLVLINSGADHVSDVLKAVLYRNVLDCVQVKIMSILVDRYSKRHFSCHNMEKIVNVLVQKVLMVNDKRQYLILCYFKVIFLFLKSNKTIKVWGHCIEGMRNSYREVGDIYKTFIFLLLLTQVPSKNDSDKRFIKNAVEIIQNMNLQHFETAEMVSEMLPHLYTNANCICGKYGIFKVAVFLIVEHGLYTFVSFITKTQISSCLVAVMAIFDFDFLTRCFDSDKVAFQIVKEFYEFIISDSARSPKNVNKTYYVEEKNVYVDRLYIDKIVFKFLRDFYKKHGNVELFRYYEGLRCQN